MKSLLEDTHGLIRNPRLLLQYIMIALFLLAAGFAATYRVEVQRSMQDIQSRTNSLNYTLEVLKTQEQNTPRPVPDVLQHVQKAQAEVEAINDAAQTIKK